MPRTPLHALPLRGRREGAAGCFLVASGSGGTYPRRASGVIDDTSLRDPCRTARLPGLANLRSVIAHSVSLLYTATALYGIGSSIAIAGMFARSRKAVQDVAFAVMAIGFVTHTLFIGTVCVRTGHPPLLNLAEVASFIAWTLLLIDVVLYVTKRVDATAIVVYPLAFALLLVAAIAGDPFAPADASHRAPLFTAHVLLSTVGIALLFIGFGFSILATVEHRSLKGRKQGRLWESIPSLAICTWLSDRALATGLVVYTAGVAAGLIWSVRTDAGLRDWGAKQTGAIVAWALFTLVVQSHFTGILRARRTTLALSAVAFVAMVISIFGIAHV